MINAGELTRTVLIRKWSDVPNSAFGITQTEDAGISRRAKHEPVHGLAIRAGMQLGEVPTDLFYVRRGTGTKQTDITVEHVIEWNGRRYRVLDTLDVEDAQRFTRITTKDLGAI